LPAAGRAATTGIDGTAQWIGVGAGPTDRRGGDLFLPVPRLGKLLSLEISWDAPAATPLRFETLRLEERGATARPPIVFVSIDTFAARHLEAYGYARATAPNLTRLAEESVLFERCSANAPWTMPSYLSVMTGLYPGANHVPLVFSEDVRLDNWDWWQVADNRWTLADALRGRGYQTRMNAVLRSYYEAHKNPSPE